MRKFDNKINLYLQPTKYIDCDNPEIKKFVVETTQFCNSEVEKAKELFKWVKENIKFEFGYWGFKASEVLKRKVGMCTTKATLLIAFLRAIGIPAGYGILKIITKEFYGELMCPSFSKLVSSQTVHIYLGIFLNKKKLMKCDPSVDIELARSLSQNNPFAQMTGFDITEEKIKNIKGIITKSEILLEIDKELDKPPRNAKGVNLEILNSYLRFLRSTKMALKCSSDQELENHFLAWLKKENLKYYEFLKQFSNN